MWAFKRRLNIVLLILATVICFGVIPYYLTHREVPSCFDGKQNQGEEGVDCGGGCALVCKGKAEALKVLWSKIDEVREGTFEVAFSVENPNVSVGARRVPYTITLYGEDGQEIGERTGVTYAGSNEAFLIYEGKISTGSHTLDSAKLVFGDFPWVTTDKRKEMFSIIDKQLTQVDTHPKLSALVRNDTTLPAEEVEVVALISDDRGEVVGYGKTLIDYLLPGEAKPVTFSWTKSFSYQASLESCDKPMDIALLLDRSGSMQSISKDPPEPFTMVKNAAAGFIDSIRSIDQVAVVSFATEASQPIEQQLTSVKGVARDKTLLVEIGKDGTQYTNTGSALLFAKQELDSRRHRKEALRALVLLTDGEANEPNRPEREFDPEYPKQYALEVAQQAKDEDISIYTIGLGVNANSEFLKMISTEPEYYYQSPSPDDLGGIYKKISSVLCKKAPSVIEVLPRVNNVP